MAKKTAYERYVDELKSGTVDAAFIRGFRKALHAADRDRRGYHGSRTAPKLDWQDAVHILRMLPDFAPRVGPKLERQGLEWLKDRRRKELGDRERSVVENFSHFTLTDMYDAGNAHGCFFLPVWTVHSKDGRRFSYVAGSWQSGFGAKIVG